METCDVCQMEFPSGKPNKAVADAKIRGLDLWGYLCEGHVGHGVPGSVTKLVEE